jgi:hypothetical protein
MFNLTIAYKRDADIIRYFGDLENTIRVARYEDKSGVLLLEDDEYFKVLIAEKGIFIRPRI